MFRTISKTRTAMAAATAAAALALPAAASAETPPYTPTTTYTTPCTEIYDTAGSYFDVKLCNVSDIDQKRDLLPNDGGGHCGPASLFNSLHYLQHRKGVPSEFYIPFWNVTTKLANVHPHEPSGYSIGSYWIGRLGDEASWSAEKGTNMTNLRKAFGKATTPAGAAGWTVSTGAVDSSTITEFGQQMAKHLRFAPLQLVYGRYAQDGDALRRGGGHIVTVTRVRGYVGSNEIKLTLHDPARSADDDPWIDNDGDLNAQSPVQDEEVTLKRVTYTEVSDSSYTDNAMDDGGSGGGGGGFWRPITRWELTGDNYKPKPGKPTRQMVDGYNWFMAQKTLNP